MLIVEASGPELELGNLPALARAEGHAFVDRTVLEWTGGNNRFDKEGERFFVARIDGQPIAMCGLNIDPFIQNPRVGRLRHLFVAAQWRRSGVGRELVTACLEGAEGTFDRVRLRTFDQGAAAFYTALGFSPLDERDATHGIDCPWPG